MIIRSMASVADIDCFIKAVAKDGECQIRLKTGECVMRSFGKNDLDAIRNMKNLIDTLIDEKASADKPSVS